MCVYIHIYVYSHTIICTHMHHKHMCMYTCMFTFSELGVGTGEPWNTAGLCTLYVSPFSSFLYLFNVVLIFFK